MGELRATASVGPVRLAASVPAERAISATTWRRPEFDGSACA